MVTSEEFQSVYDQGPEAAFAVVSALEAVSAERETEVRRLEELILALGERIKELENRLNKDSHNSSKPPSSDGLAKKTRSQRGKSGRPSGGQKGHPGRTLEFSEQPNVVVVHAPSCCQECGASHLGPGLDIETGGRGARCNM